MLRSMRIIYKSEEEIALMREASLAVAEILARLCEAAQPGVTTWDLDRLAAEEIARLQVKSAFLGYPGGTPYDYPAVLCTSVNEVVVHGIPRKDEVLAAGDIIGLDFGVFKRGFCGDSCRTVVVGGQTTPDRQTLVDVTWEALNRGIDQCVEGKRLGDVGAAIQDHVEANGFSVVRKFVGHGIGRRMHEDPAVPNHGKPNTKKRLKTGLVIAIEPMVNAGAHEIDVLDDQWTAVTRDRSMSAHFEDTVAITKDGPWVLSRPASQPGKPAHHSRQTP